jgi:hypothetical protein
MRRQWPLRWRRRRTTGLESLSENHETETAREFPGFYKDSRALPVLVHGGLAALVLLQIESGFH